MPLLMEVAGKRAAEFRAAVNPGALPDTGVMPLLKFSRALLPLGVALMSLPNPA